ncbi:MAG: glutamate--cysteine ligase [Candidatus Omnitrophica bacterium]|nr:glutamate--cysteine ligase [Candidatus Omnitrophota bacterium]
MNKLTLANNFSQTICVPCIQHQQQQIHEWLQGYEKIYTPIYSSVDIRDAGFKIAVVDTNLFPAGFNNLCEHGIEDSIDFIKDAINKRVPHAKNILIVTEDYTRNTGYLESVRILQDIITKAGFKTNVSMLKDIQAGQTSCDLIIINNDLTGGIPEALVEAGIPIFPSIHAGWHSRLKSEHFRHTNELMKEFAYMVGLDPWLFSCLYRMVDHIDINSNQDRQKLYRQAKDLFEEIQTKYTQHSIEEKPFIFIKADSGTYGLGVVPVETPEQILDFNRHKRNDLSHGKDAQETTRFLLQEGVATIHRIEEKPSEVCVYQIDNNLVGGFYRFHTTKSSRENLNSPGGMGFQKMCPHLDKYGKDCGIKHDLNIFDIYRILARIAGVAAAREIKALESKKP